jgi:hypothetical protein
MGASWGQLQKRMISGSRGNLAGSRQFVQGNPDDSRYEAEKRRSLRESGFPPGCPAIVPPPSQSGLRSPGSFQNFRLVERRTAVIEASPHHCGKRDTREDTVGTLEP